MLKTFGQLAGENSNPGVGSKATALIELSRIGIDVPDGAVLCFEALHAFLEHHNLLDAFIKALSTQDPEKSQFLRKQLTTLPMPTFVTNKITAYISEKPGDRFAIRSSGSKEDLAGASFAGLYATILNVRSIDDVIDAIKSCWASMLDIRVYQYCQQHKILTDDLKNGRHHPKDDTRTKKRDCLFDQSTNWF